MNWLATLLAKMFGEWLGFQQKNAETPKKIEHADKDEKLAQEWRDYLEKHGVHPPLPGATGSLPYGYGPADGVSNKRE